jgi:hypothetical protein
VTDEVKLNGNNHGQHTSFPTLILKGGENALVDDNTLMKRYEKKKLRQVWKSKRNTVPFGVRQGMEKP